MKKEDQLTDALLKEHARKGAGADEQFLKELEERLDEQESGEKVVPMTPKPESAGSRWALGAGVAACLALGLGGVYFRGGNQQGDIIAYEDTSHVQEEIVSYSSRERVVGRESSPLAPAAGDHASELDDTEVKGAKTAKDTSGWIQSEKESDLLKRGAPKFVEVNGKRYLLDLSKTRGNSNKRSKSEFGKVVGIGDELASLAAKPSTLSAERENPLGVNDSSVSCASNTASVIRVRGSINTSEGYFGARAPLAKKRKAAQIGGVHVSNKVRLGEDYIGRPVPHQNTERYGQLVENKFTAPIDERSALSTFAVDVDTASYANLRRMINHGQRIPADSVRIEEMVNYFDYDYAQPTGEHPFGVHVDSVACPWNEKHRIVRIGVQGKEIVREERPATNLVFLLDVSGSMNSSNKLPLLKQSMKYLLEELNDQDTVSIVVYAGASGLALPATKVDDAGRQLIEKTMDKLSAGGSTAGGQGIKLAYDVAQQNFKKGGVNRIILATDGDFNVGVSDNASLTKLVKEKAKDGTYLSVLGFGQGNINDAMLESITNSGNGNYSYIDSVKEGRKVLLEDMMGTMVTIAKDVKVQVVMHPNKVKAYRLIGYANRMLPPEAFLDKKVDAGEIGAGHTVTALYEIIPADGTPFGENIDASRYFKKQETKPNPALKDSPEMLFVKLAYKQPNQKMEDESTYVSVPFIEDPKAKATADMQWAQAVALFGMVVRDSENKGSGDLQKVLELAKSGKGSDGKGQREEFIQLVEKLAAKE